MTYQSEVLVDAPFQYLRLDETSGTTAANLGSSGTAATISANITMGEPSAGTIDGTSMRFPSALAASVSAATGGTMGTTYTIEVWFKRDTSITTGNRCLVRVGSATNNHKLYVDFAGQAVRLTDSASGTSTLATVPAVFDGNWHHLAVTRNGGNVIYYVDGASVAAGPFPNTARSLAFTVGSSSAAAEAPAGWIDEAAYYTTVLDPARIAAHYAAGSGPVGTPVSIQAPAITANLSAPNVTVKTDKGAMILAPAMVVSVTAPAPIVTAVDILKPTYTATEDRQSNGSGTETSLSALGTQKVYIKFPSPFTLVPGTRIKSAKLRVNVIGQNGIDYYVDRITQSWVENGTTAVSATIDVNAPTGKIGTTADIDLSLYVAAWNAAPAGFHGVAITTDQTTYPVNISSRESANPPKLILELEQAPVSVVSKVVGPGALSIAAPNAGVRTGIPKTVTVEGAAVVNAIMPQHRFGTGTKVSAGGAGSVNVVMVAPSAVFPQRNITIKPHNVALTLQMPGGISRNPDQFIKAGPMEAWIFAPNATQYIAVPSINTAPPMEVSLAGTSDTNISLKTDRRVFVTTPMKMNTNMVGIYNREADRYLNYVPLTADRDDIWYQMEETGGTVAVDALTGLDGATVIDKLDGTYVGGPTFGAEGPKLRKAIHFDGVDDHVKFPVYLGAFTNSDMSYEFSLRTTQENGVVLGNGGIYKTQTMGNQGGTYTGGDIRLVNGRLVLRAGSIDYTINKYVADGEWHHVVISLPHGTQTVPDFATSTGRQHFVMVDGQTVWGRYTVGYNTMTFLPLSAMARVNSSGQAEEALAGEMRDLIVRLNYAVSQNTARKLYYEWSETLIVNPEPMTASINMPKPHSAKGNVKRMIVLYGLPYKLYRQQKSAGYFRDGWGTYFSIFAGFFIPTNVGESQGGTGAVTNEFQAQYGAPQIATNPTPMVFLQPKPFMLNGYMCYPVAVATTPGASGAWDAPGMVKDGLRDPITGQLIDDATGLNRFIDITQDLNEPITDYDAITAVNYPAIQPIENNVTANAVEDFEQHNLGLNKDEWAQARDRLRDSILDAAYSGVNLWVNEPHMAEHLGFIKAWDKHETGARVEFFGAGNIDATGYTNTAAQAIDQAHLTGVASNDAGIAAPGIGQYNYTWQANAKRQVAATEPGLTDIPSFEYGDRVSYQAADMWRPHASYTAYDLQDKTNGLVIGDKLGMDMWEQNDYSGNYPSFDNFSVGVPRKYIVSARPDGVAGKIISKEMDTYYGPYGVVRVNPWRNNVYTIAAEKGTVVRGRPIAGRAFVELMDTMTTVYALPSDRDKSAWKGEAGHNVTSWSFDSRRYRELVATWTAERVKTTKGGAAVVVSDQVSKMEVENPQFIYHPHVSMNARGLRWLQLSDTLPAGDAKAYVPAMELDVAGTGVEVENTRNTVIMVTGHMRLDAELRAAANYSDGDVREKALPMVINLEMRGTGKHIKVSNAMELSLSTLDARVVGDGDKIYVYMDEATEITLFMKED